jgi:hypothetical protein
MYNLSYTAFLQGHLNYLVGRLFAVQGEEQKDMIRSIRRVRSIVNEEEFLRLKTTEDVKDDSSVENSEKKDD